MEHYLDNAATSHPKPPEVVAAVIKAMTLDNANPGRSGHRRAIRAAETVFHAREQTAALMRAADSSRIAFCLNCTDALNLAIKGSLARGDHIICSALEHNSVLRVIHALEESGEIELTIISPESDGCVDPVRFSQAIRRNTRLIELTHASNVTGAIQPVREVGQIARANGIRYLIDGSQTLGALPVNVNDVYCDLYAFPGHKSLLGPQGTGGLYLSEGTTLRPLRQGGTGSTSESLNQPDELPDRYESGTLNLPGLAGLGAGCKYVQEHLAEIRSREEALSQQIWEELAKIPGITLYSPQTPRARVGIVSFNIRDLSSGTAADWFSSEDICLRGGLHCAPLAHDAQGTLKRGCVRASIGYANTAEDVEALIRCAYLISKKAE